MMYFCFNDPSPPELYTLSLHDALPISARHSPLQAGVHFDRASGCDLFFVTTEKSEREYRSEEHTSELQSLTNLVCRLLLEKKKESVACVLTNTTAASRCAKS